MENPVYCSAYRNSDIIPGVRLSVVFSVLAVIALIAATPAAHASTLNTGDILEIRFTVTAPSCTGGPCDALLLLPFEGGSYFATDVTANLFNGATLLGTYSSATCCAPSFRSSSSLFTGDAATVDFTSIDAGTINGILDMSIANGYLTWPGAPTPELVLLHGGGIEEGSGLHINSVSILSAPEPSTGVTILGGVAVLILQRARANKKRAAQMR